MTPAGTRGPSGPGTARGRTAGAAGGVPGRGGNPGSGPGGRTGGAGGRGAGERRWRLVQARSDAVPPSVRRFMRRARQRRLRAAAPWAAIAGLLLLAAVVAWVFYGTGLFGVRDVRVVGVSLVTPEEVRRAAAVPDGTPLARVDLSAAGDRVGELAPVFRATVVRDWPDRLVIEVVERSGVAVAPRRDGGFAVIDATGVAFQVLPRRPAALPLVRIDAPGPQDPATRGALQVLDVLTPELRERLVEVVVVGPAQIQLRLAQDRTVIWGDASRGEAKARVATELLDQRGKTIDVSAPEVVTVR